MLGQSGANSHEAVAVCTDWLYSGSMTSKKIPFSEARQNLTSIVDEVEKFGRAVTIVRRGKPAAVIVDHDTYHQFVESSAQKKWTLKGSIIVKPGVDLDRDLANAKEARIRMWKGRQAKLTKQIRES